ncbi:MAG: penicillin-binding protein 1A [Nostocaceae cyanobacterium]|nr:penicillin-binding protein 1A [Nostocaceae cyanobacterium]
MAKFTSWFKPKSTTLKDSKKDSETKKPVSLPGNNHENNSKSESTPENPPSKEVKRLGGKKPLYRRYWFWATLGMSGSIIAIGYGIWSIDSTLPDKSALNALVREKTLTIKAADGSILQQQGEATREQLQLEEIPEQLQAAFIASEDRRFQQHHGIDVKGIGRAVLNNLRSQNVVQGGSTITQQLARILFLKQERTMLRKLKEARLAQKIEEELTKNEILERYLNLVYLGSGAYGVADAAWVYFSKSVDKLTLSEMATIAALPPAPNSFSPKENPQLAQQRRNLVLQRMLEDGLITRQEHQAATAEPIALKPSPPKRWEIEAPYFISYIQKELPKYVDEKVLRKGGLTVETTLNPQWQEAAEEAVNKTLGDEGRWQRFKQGAMVAIDPRNGQIKAMVGGKDFDKNQFNRVTQAQRQPGSTFKGFVYAAAIASGRSPYDGYRDSPLVVDGYEPKNFDKSYRGWINMRDALTKSINIVAVRALMKVGFEPTIKLAQDMGIKSQLKPMYSLALGSNEVNLLELTSAYGTFATQGLHTEAHGITRILNRRGEVIWEAKFRPKLALDPDSAAIMSWMLRRVVTSGTGSPAQLGRPVAGKTGTTDDSRDLWFIGYIPQLVTGVWLGNDDNKSTNGNSGTAAYTWRQFMKEAVEGMPVEKFPSLPKLKGRKGTIKAEPIKPKRVVNRSIPSRNYDNDSDSSSTASSSSSSRRRRQQVSSNNNNQPRYRRRRRRRRSYSRQQQENSSRSTRRSYRRRSRTQQSNSSSSSRSSSPRRQTRSSSRSSSQRRRTRSSSRSSSPQRQNRRVQPKPAAKPQKSAAPAKQPSWRERLKPGSSSQ